MHKILFFLAAAALLLQPARGDTRDDVWAAMRRCQVFQDDRTWLDCTYGAQQPMRAKLKLPPAPESQQRLVPSSQLPAAQSYVAPAPRRAAAVEAPQRSASIGQIITGTAAPIAVSTLARLDYDGEGAFVVTLENGQVWRQINVEGVPKAHFKLGTRVSITPGALWSFNLKTDDGGRVYKVRRKQ